MLERRGVEFSYRDYRREPLATDELHRLLALLGRPARELLRRRDRAFRELGLRGDEDDETLIAHIAEHPTLLERPIGATRDRAVVGRPPELLLELAERG